MHYLEIEQKSCSFDVLGYIPSTSLVAVSLKLEYYLSGANEHTSIRLSIRDIILLLFPNKRGVKKHILHL